MRFPIILCLLFLAPLFLVAQEKEELEMYDIVETMTGERHEGNIVHYEYGKILTIALRDGSELTLASNEIRRVRYARERRASRSGQGDESSAITESYVDDWRNELTARSVRRKVRPSLALMVHGGKQSDNSNGFFFNETRTFGYSLEGLINYRVMPWLDLGMGAAFDRFNTNLGESTISWLGAVQILPSPKKNIAPYFRLAAGYGSPVKTERNSFSDKEGGLLIHPGIGIRIGRAEEIFYTLDFGYRILQTKYNIETFQGEEKRTNNYRRLSLRLGATF